MKVIRINESFYLPVSENLKENFFVPPGMDVTNAGYLKKKSTILVGD